VAWDLWVGQVGGATGRCCFSGSSTTVTLNNAGVYRFATQAIDGTLNLSTRQSTVVRIGEATGEPPVASATLDKQSGPTPLTVNIDMSASFDLDGAVQYYFFDCGGGSLTPGTQVSKASCTFDTQGVYWILLQAQDDSGNVDTVSAYAVATPVQSGGGSDTTPPTVSITSPTPGANVSGSVSVTAGASDASGISKVTFYRDASVLLGAATTSPYVITWDPSTVSAGAHSLYAVATDNAGNTGTSPAVGITVSILVPPQVSVTSPTNGATVPRKSKVALKASATPTDNPVSRVDFIVGSSVVCSATTSPYSCNWQVPAKANTSYQIHANAYDTTGQVGVSSNVTIKAK
jgi:hypothetical protein